MKTVAELHVDLSRFVKVSSAKRIGAIQKEALIRDVHCLQGYSPALTEAFPKRQTECCMTGQMIWPITVQKA